MQWIRRHYPFNAEQTVNILERVRAAGDDVPRQRHLRHRGRDLGADHHDHRWRSIAMLVHVRPPADLAAHRRRGHHRVRRPDAGHGRCRCGCRSRSRSSMRCSPRSCPRPEARAATSSSSSSARRSTTPRKAGTSSRATWRGSSFSRRSSTRRSASASRTTHFYAPSTGCSPASTSGSCSSCSSSCRSRHCSCWWQCALAAALPAARNAAAVHRRRSR